MARLLISDANILIDLECCGLSARAFQIGYDVAVLDVLFEEELRSGRYSPPMIEGCAFLP